MLNKILLIVTFIVFIWSGIEPYDRTVWYLEVAPVIIGLPLVIWLHRKYKLTTLLLVLMTIHAVILCIGGKYTYAKVPIGIYFQEMFGWARNHYDRLGHLAQGFIPAIMARELLIRKNVVNSKGFLFLFVFTICLSFSVFYEFLEWFAAVFSEEGAQDFLGSQGDIWDSHWDMLFAVIGAILSYLTLSKYHNTQLQKVRRTFSGS